MFGFVVPQQFRASIEGSASKVRKILRRLYLRFFASEFTQSSRFANGVFDVLPGKRDEVPALTHVDGTARVQTVSESDNPLYYRMISEFEKLTGVPMVVNTSFNDNNEPIVASPADAVACYLKTDVDALALGPFWTEKDTL